MNVDYYIKNGAVSEAMETETIMWKAPARQVLLRREQTFTGFCQIEQNQGGLNPSENLSGTRGQECIRIIFARVLEELTEAADANDPQHFMEELIDVVNYATSMIFFKYSGRQEVIEEVIAGIDHLFSEKKISGCLSPTHFSGIHQHPVYTRTIPSICLAFSELLAKLRNRSWQNGSQHPCFMGQMELVNAVLTVWSEVFEYFPNRMSFLELFLAKDMVLQFRLQSNY